jgi:hypothetical protein
MSSNRYSSIPAQKTGFMVRRVTDLSRTSILKLANYAEVNLQEAYREKMLRNLQRNWRTASELAEEQEKLP